MHSHTRSSSKKCPANIVSIPFSSGRAFAPWIFGAELFCLFVSIPFSSGRAFAQNRHPSGCRGKLCFNPLLIGACIRTSFSRRPQWWPSPFQSPSHRGVHSHDKNRTIAGRCSRCFNPLLIGACIRTATNRANGGLERQYVSIPFSSGRAFARRSRSVRRIRRHVSIPFSSGRAFARLNLATALKRCLNCFNPLLIGACIRTDSIETEAAGFQHVSIPFSSGRAFALLQCIEGEKTRGLFQSPSHRGVHSHRTQSATTIIYECKFQSPSHRGVHSHLRGKDTIAEVARVFQSPSHRGVHSHAQQLWGEAVSQSSFNPLLIGACIRTTIITT